MNSLAPPAPTRPALFLDFDGTLVDIADRPGDVVVDPALPDLLDRIVERTEGAVAVITGRKIEDIDRFLGVSLAAAGLHGLERRAQPGAEVATEPAPPEMATLHKRIDELGLIGDGVTLEDKGAGIAVHYRAVPHRGDEVRDAFERAMHGLDSLQLLAGKMVYEAKSKGFDKGAAVDTFMSSFPFAGRTPVFIGDDTTDEDGMRAANARGGFGIKVGGGDTVAPYRLDDVQAVHYYLLRLLGPDS